MGGCQQFEMSLGTGCCLQLLFFRYCSCWIAFCVVGSFWRENNKFRFDAEWNCRKQCTAFKSRAVFPLWSKNSFAKRLCRNYILMWVHRSSNWITVDFFCIRNRLATRHSNDLMNKQTAPLQGQSYPQRCRSFLKRQHGRFEHHFHCSVVIQRHFLFLFQHFSSWQPR